MDLKLRGWEGVDWIDLYRDKQNWQVLTSHNNEFSDTIKWGGFLLSAEVMLAFQEALWFTESVTRKYLTPLENEPLSLQRLEFQNPSWNILGK